MIALSEPQKEALRQIKQLNEWMIKSLGIPEDKCWFIQGALKRVTRHTLQALKGKGYLEDADYIEERPMVEYYKWTGKELE